MCDEQPDEEQVTLPIDGTLDLHTFAPRDVAAVVVDYLDECRRVGIHEVRIVHGKGRGVQRRIVHSALEKLDYVRSFRLADGAGGSWGATLVDLVAGSDVTNE